MNFLIHSFFITKSIQDNLFDFIKHFMKNNWEKKIIIKAPSKKILKDWDVYEKILKSLNIQEMDYFQIQNFNQQLKWTWNSQINRLINWSDAYFFIDVKSIKWIEPNSNYEKKKIKDIISLFRRNWF